MLDFFPLPKDGFHSRRLGEAFKHVFSATIFFGTKEQSDASSMVDWARFHFFDNMTLWYSKAGRCSVEKAESDGNVVTLSEIFYKEIDEHRIPVEREVVSLLAHAPDVLDFYLWLTWKSWTVNVSSRTPIAGSAGLCDQLGIAHYSSSRRFRHLIQTPAFTKFNERACQ
jgi:Plasmid encoded RepA protein